MLANKTIVVTGANGALGRAVCEVAQAQGASLIRLDLVFTEPVDNCHEVDLTDASAVRSLLDSLGG